MSNLTYKCWGGRGFTCQINRIEEGLNQLGLKESDYDSTFVFSNDAGTHKEAIHHRKHFAPKAKLILNVLDLFLHLQGENAQNSRAKLQEQLKHADVVTTISHSVARELDQYFGLKNVPVISVPQMPVYKDESLKGKSKYRAAMVGRLNDPNKRTILGIRALQLLGFQENEVLMCGSEYPGWGHVGGVLTVNALNELYNNVDFVICPSRYEGILLPICEAAGCGAIPIICSDLTTREELFSSAQFPEYNSVFPDVLSIANFIARFMQDNGAKEQMKKKVYNHYIEKLKDRFSNIGVAQNILNLL